MRRLLLVLTLVVAPAASAGAQTLTTRDIIELSKAGLGEQVLLALIEVNQSVFPVDKDTLKALKEAGVAGNVIVAMVRSGRDPIAAPEPKPQVQTVIVQHDDVDATSARERELERELERAHERERERDMERSRAASRWSTQYAVPVAVPVPVYIPVSVRPRQPERPKEPVYWGWDGKLRPDAWKPAEPARPPKGPGR